MARAGTRGDATGWMIVAGVALALANATAYWSALLDPMVLAAALLIAYPKPGGKQAIGRGRDAADRAGHAGHGGHADRR